MPRNIIGFLTAAMVALFAVTMSVAQSQTSGSDGSATETPALPEPLTPASIDALVSRLSDEEVRNLLLRELNSEVPAADPDVAESNIGEIFHNATVGAFGEILGGITGLPQALVAEGRAIRNFTEKNGAASWGILALMLLAAVAAGLLAEWLVNRAIVRWVSAREIVEAPTLRESASFLGRRLAKEVLGVFVFYVVASIFLSQALPDTLSPLAISILFSLIAIPRLTYSVSRFLLAPNHPEYRLVHTDDATARFLARHPVGLAIVGGLSFVTIEFNLSNLDNLQHVGLGFWFDLAFRLYLVWIIWRAWDGIVSAMRGRDPEITPFEDAIARAYPGFAIAVVFLMWWILATIASFDALRLIEGRGDMITLTLLLLAPALDTLIRGLVHHLTPPMKGEGPIAERAYVATRSAYKRIGRVVVFGLALVLIANAWGLSTDHLAGAGTAGRIIGVFFEAIFDVMFVLIFGYLAYEVVTLWINRKLAAERTARGLTAEAASSGDIGGTGGTRLSTVLPLLRVVLQVAIVVVFGLAALGELGIDTTPLLAGAGIAGLAIGFGAQKLVSDVVSGAFFLIDDAFRMGEYVEVGDTKGTVERISIRSMQLRHHRGPVFTVPYGEIPYLKNYSRDWGIMKLPFIFPFDTDPDKVRKIFKKIGQDLLEHPEYGEYFIEPFKSQGVFQIDDVGMTIRGKFTAKPGKQFEIRKEVFTRVRHALDAAGIPFARREVRVALPDLEPGKELSEDDKNKIAGAASSAVQDSVQPDK